MVDEEIKESQGKSVEIEVPPQAFGKPKDQVRVRTKRYRRIYANNLAIEFSMWDSSVIFGEIIGEKDGQPVIEELVHVNMSHAFAKTIAAVFANNIKGFEKKFGEIKIPVIDEATMKAILEEKAILEGAEKPIGEK